jgi:hypothetical protein
MPAKSAAEGHMHKFMSNERLALQLHSMGKSQLAA